MDKQAILGELRIKNQLSGERYGGAPAIMCEKYLIRATITAQVEKEEEEEKMKKDNVYFNFLKCYY